MGKPQKRLELAEAATVKGMTEEEGEERKEGKRREDRKKVEEKEIMKREIEKQREKKEVRWAMRLEEEGRRKEEWASIEEGGK